MLMLLEPQLLVKPVCLHLAVFSECSSSLYTIRFEKTAVNKRELIDIVYIRWLPDPFLSK